MSCHVMSCYHLAHLAHLASYQPVRELDSNALPQDDTFACHQTLVHN